MRTAPAKTMRNNFAAKSVSLKMSESEHSNSEFYEGPEGVKWDWDWPKIWVGKWDLIHGDWDFCTGNWTQNIKWKWEFCFNPLSKNDFF